MKTGKRFAAHIFLHVGLVNVRRLWYNLQSTDMCDSTCEYDYVGNQN